MARDPRRYPSGCVGPGLARTSQRESEERVIERTLGGLLLVAACASAQVQVRVIGSGPVPERRPLHGDVVVVQGMVNWAGRTSMEVGTSFNLAKAVPFSALKPRARPPTPEAPMKMG